MITRYWSEQLELKLHCLSYQAHVRDLYTLRSDKYTPSIGYASRRPFIRFDIFRAFYSDW